MSIIDTRRTHVGWPPEGVRAHSEWRWGHDQSARSSGELHRCRLSRGRGRRDGSRAAVDTSAAAWSARLSPGGPRRRREPGHGRPPPAPLRPDRVCCAPALRRTRSRSARSSADSAYPRSSTSRSTSSNSSTVRGPRPVGRANGPFPKSASRSPWDRWASSAFPVAVRWAG